MLRLLLSFFLSISGLIFNNIIFEKIKLDGVRPDFFLISVVSIAVLRNDIESALFGFLCGLIRDIFFGHILGFFAICYMLIGYLCGLPFKYFYRENYFVPMILCFFASIGFETIIFIFISRDFIFSALKIILYESVYNTVFIFVIYPILYFFNKKLEIYEIRHNSFF